MLCYLVGYPTHVSLYGYVWISVIPPPIGERGGFWAPSYGELFLLLSAEMERVKYSRGFYRGETSLIGA